MEHYQSIDPQTVCSGYLVLFNYGDGNDHIRPDLIHRHLNGAPAVKATPAFTQPMADALYYLQKEKFNTGLPSDEMQLSYCRIFLLYLCNRPLTPLMFLEILSLK